MSSIQIEKNNEKNINKDYPKQHSEPYILDRCVRNRVCAAGMLQQHCRRPYPDF